MTVSDQVITNDYAIYRGDCVEVAESLPSNSIDMSVYSPPFAGLFQYSGDEGICRIAQATISFISNTGLSLTRYTG
jgi:DNA modification methylase